MSVAIATATEGNSGMSGWLGRYAWVPVPLLLALIAGLWAFDLRAVYESRALMVLLNLVFTWLASLCVCVLTARGFLATGEPALFMFGCGSLLWGAMSLAAAMLVDSGVNATVTVHNLGVLGAASCHFAGLAWRGRLTRRSRWLTGGYAGALVLTALIVWAATSGLTPLFFVQGQGGTPLRQAVLLLAIPLFAWVAWRLLRTARWQPDSMYYWYGLGLALVATGLSGVALLSVQGGALGWTNRLTQYLGSAYLFVAARMAVRETGSWTFSLAAVNAPSRERGPAEAGRRQSPPWLLRYGLAAAAVAAGWGFRLGITASVGPTLPPFVTFYPAIMVVAVLLGPGPAVLATALTCASVAYWVLPPAGQFAIASPADRVGVVVLAAAGLFLAWFAEAYRRDRDKAAAHDRDAASRESRDRLVAFARATFEGIVESDAGRIVDCNEQLARMAGYSVEELRGREIADLLPPEERGRVAANIAQGRESVIEHVLLRKDGTRLVVEAHGRPCSAGRSTRQTVIRNVTERKRAEEALREADRRKSEFIAVLSHELRNPLAPIHNSIHLLDLAPPQGEVARRAREVIHRQTEHLTRLVDDLLDVTRITHGKFELQRARLDAREVVRRACDDLGTVFEQRRVALRYTQPAEPAWVDADAARLAQMVGNLVTNALKFTERGGRVDVGVQTAGGACEVRVRDTGVGIEAADLERIFDPFVQAERTRAGAQGGLGIGLALVRELASRHGGAVRATSAGPGQGAEFTLTLPLAPVPADPVGETVAARGASGLWILIVEDNEDAGASLADLLTLGGHEVAVATTARAGIAMASAHPPDVLLCDVGLPDLSGHDVIRALRERPEGRSVFAVALTGYAQPEDRAKALSAGFDAHLAKPPALDRLDALLAEAAGRRARDGRRPAGPLPVAGA
jgi:PAS domain S-box-containing protein